MPVSFLVESVSVYGKNHKEMDGWEGKAKRGWEEWMVVSSWFLTSLMPKFPPGPVGMSFPACFYIMVSCFSHVPFINTSLPCVLLFVWTFWFTGAVPQVNAASLCLWEAILSLLIPLSLWLVLNSSIHFAVCSACFVSIRAVLSAFI